MALNYFEGVRKIIGDRGKKYHITTFGCQMNENDSEKIAGMLEKMGYKRTDDIHDGDFIIFNTCCVRENAELKVFGRLGALKKLKRDNPHKIIGVCGCMMEQEDVALEILKKYENVDLVFGTHNLHMLPMYLYEILSGKKRVFNVSRPREGIVEGVPVKRDHKVKAWVTIMYGCDNFCSYCIVPHVRGRERSRDPEDILDEIGELARLGYKEVTLLGQNVNSYDMGFPDLLYRINDIEGIERIRFMTSHPKDISDDLIYAMKECAKVSNHLHLPVQSGSSRILEQMNRKYTAEKYAETVARVRSLIPRIAITTDIIVGFPSESEEDFSQTLDLVEKTRFDSAYTFIYSRRRGTPAYDREDQIHQDIKKERFKRLVTLQNRISGEINRDLLGTRTQVLVEGLSRNDENYCTGRTEQNKIVNFLADRSLVGELVEVEITRARTWSLEGKLI